MGQVRTRCGSYGQSLSSSSQQETSLEPPHQACGSPEPGMMSYDVINDNMYTTLQVITK